MFFFQFEKFLLSCNLKIWENRYLNICFQYCDFINKSFLCNFEIFSFFWFERFKSIVNAAWNELNLKIMINAIAYKLFRDLIFITTTLINIIVEFFLSKLDQELRIVLDTQRFLNFISFIHRFLNDISFNEHFENFSLSAWIARIDSICIEYRLIWFWNHFKRQKIVIFSNRFEDFSIYLTNRFFFIDSSSIWSRNSSWLLFFSNHYFEKDIIRNF